MEISPQSQINPTSSQTASHEALLSTPTRSKTHVKTLRHSQWRWIALFFGCFIASGSYYCYDIPQILQTALMNGTSINAVQFDLLYSVYSFPNIILPLFGGIIIDRLGIKVSVALTSFFVTVGQIICTLGVAKSNFDLMIAGRALFGFGSETLNVIQNVILAKWFIGKELAFALGVSSYINLMGVSVNSILSPRILTWTNSLYFPFLIGAFTCALSWISAIFLTCLDEKADKQEKLSGHAIQDKEKFSFRSLRSLKRIYFLLLANVFFMYGAYAGLDNNVSDIAVERFGFTETSIGTYMFIADIILETSVAFFGFYTDKKGKRLLFLMWSSLGYCFISLALAFLKGSTGKPDYIFVGIYASYDVFYSLYQAAFWPCIPLVVKEEMLGTAYGLAFALYNVNLTILPVIIGAMHDSTENIKFGYFWTEILLAVVTFLGIIITAILFREDKKTGGVLEAPISEEEDSHK